MTAKKGSGLLMVWAEVPADREAEFNRWYNEEHLAERLAIPGFLSGARYEAVKGGPKHLAVYELESPAVLDSDAYKKVAANPTPWTQRTGPQAVATTFIRNVYAMIHPRAVTPSIAASGMAPALQLGRMDVAAEVDREFNDWYNSIYVPNYEKVPGVIRGRRYRAVAGSPTYLTFYEFEHPRVSESPEWHAQRNAVPASERMRGHMRHAPGSPGSTSKRSSSSADVASDLTFERDGRVAVVTIARPADQNRLTREVLLTLEEIVHRLAGDDDTQAVVLTGAGSQFFSMGILNPVVRASYSKPQILELVRTANRVYDALEALPQIVIAALNGAARAGAAELSLACDIRLAAAHATFALPEALWGGFPGAGGPVRLPALVGRARALELICTGRELDAAELERLGLVLGVYPGDRLLSEAHALAARIAASGPLATRGAKRIVRTRLMSGFAEARTLSDTLRGALEWSQDVDEGMAAHREGRAPHFTGR